MRTPSFAALLLVPLGSMVLSGCTSIADVYRSRGVSDGAIERCRVRATRAGDAAYDAAPRGIRIGSPLPIPLPDNRKKNAAQAEAYNRVLALCLGVAERRVADAAYRKATVARSSARGPCAGTDGACWARHVATRERACAGGLPSPCFEAGMILARGALVPRDATRAVERFADACDAGEERGCAAARVLLASEPGARPDAESLAAAVAGGDPTAAREAAAELSFRAALDEIDPARAMPPDPAPSAPATAPAPPTGSTPPSVGGAARAEPAALIPALSAADLLAARRLRKAGIWVAIAGGAAVAASTASFAMVAPGEWGGSVDLRAVAIPAGAVALGVGLLLGLTGDSAIRRAAGRTTVAVAPLLVPMPGGGLAGLRVTTP